MAHSARLSPEAFQQRLSVSRETLERFQTYADVLTKWNRAINLVSPGTLPDLWQRHFLDSAQLRHYLPAIGGSADRVILDVGAGAGFPGLVLALLDCGEVHLVEADQRKAAFLREAIRVTGATAQLHPQRIETLPNLAVDVVTCRAFAPLPKLLELTERFLRPPGSSSASAVALLLKGRSVDGELTAAMKKWRLAIERFESETDPEAAVLRLRLPSLGDEAR